MNRVAIRTARNVPRHLKETPPRPAEGASQTRDSRTTSPTRPITTGA